MGVDVIWTKHTLQSRLHVCDYIEVCPEFTGYCLDKRKPAWFRADQQ